MKYLILNILFGFCFSFSIFACSCFGEQSFCNYIQSDYFADKGGVVCIVESTGNTENLNVEFKIIELLYGEMRFNL